MPEQEELSTLGINKEKSSSDFTIKESTEKNISEVKAKNFIFTWNKTPSLSGCITPTMRNLSDRSHVNSICDHLLNGTEKTIDIQKERLFSAASQSNTNRIKSEPLLNDSNPRSKITTAAVEENEGIMHGVLQDQESTAFLNLNDDTTSTTYLPMNTERDAQFKILIEQLNNLHQGYQLGILTAKTYHEHIANVMKELHYAHPIPTTTFFQELNDQNPSTQQQQQLTSSHLQKLNNTSPPRIAITIPDILLGLKCFALTLENINKKNSNTTKNIIIDEEEELIALITSISLCLLPDIILALQQRFKETSFKKKETQHDHTPNFFLNIDILIFYFKELLKIIQHENIASLKNEEDHLRLILLELEDKSFESDIFEFILLLLEKIYSKVVSWNEKIILIQTFIKQAIMNDNDNQILFQHPTLLLLSNYFHLMNFIFPESNDLSNTKMDYLIKNKNTLKKNNLSFKINNASSIQCYECCKLLCIFRFYSTLDIKNDVTPIYFCSKCFLSYLTKNSIQRSNNNNTTSCSIIVCELPFHIIINQPLQFKKNKYAHNFLSILPQSYLHSSLDSAPLIIKCTSEYNKDHLQQQTIPTLPSLNNDDLKKNTSLLSFEDLKKKFKNDPNHKNAIYNELPNGGIQLTAQHEVFTWTQVDEHHIIPSSPTSYINTEMNHFNNNDDDPTIKISQLISGEISSSPNNNNNTTMKLDHPNVNEKVVRTLRIETNEGDIHCQSYLSEPPSMNLLHEVQASGNTQSFTKNECCPNDVSLDSENIFHNDIPISSVETIYNPIIDNDKELFDDDLMSNHLIQTTVAVPSIEHQKLTSSAILLSSSSSSFSLMDYLNIPKTSNLSSSSSSFDPCCCDSNISNKFQQRPNILHQMSISSTSSSSSSIKQHHNKQTHKKTNETHNVSMINKKEKSNDSSFTTSEHDAKKNEIILDLIEKTTDQSVDMNTANKNQNSVSEIKDSPKQMVDNTNPKKKLSIGNTTKRELLTSELSSKRKSRIQPEIKHHPVTNHSKKNTITKSSSHTQANSSQHQSIKPTLPSSSTSQTPTTKKQSQHTNTATTPSFLSKINQKTKPQKEGAYKGYSGMRYT